jgi:GNAT superfamily N-acetyltransferase
LACSHRLVNGFPYQVLDNAYQSGKKTVMAFEISTDAARLDAALIHSFLANESTWAKGISIETVRCALAHSLCFGGYVDARQVAFARVVSDYATFAYLADVFVLADARGQGYSLALMDAVIAHPRLQRLRRFLLATSSAHALYARYGFAAPARPQALMERYDANAYVG